MRRFIDDDDASGLSAASVEKIRVIIMFLSAIQTSDELRTVPMWKVHRLTGDQKGTWRLMVTRNWRLTFRVDEKAREIVGLDYQDYQDYH